jgi:GNAT superfamily N-acetyltransferase
MQYWLFSCSNYCLGLFITAEESNMATFATARPVDSQAPTRKSVLIAHIIATKTTNSTIRGDDLELPYDPSRENETRVHKEHGNTIVMQPMNVLPEYRGIGVGTSMLREYCERMARARTADVIVAVAKPELYQFCQNNRIGFVCGAIVVQYGEEWTEMRVNLAPVREYLQCVGR